MSLDSEAKRLAALLDQPVILPDGTVDQTDRANLLDEYFASTVPAAPADVTTAGLFTPPTTTGAAFTGDTPAAARLFAHYAPTDRGRNVYILKDGTVTENTPVGLDGWANVAHACYGAHTEPVTASEITLLTAAGYGAYIT